MKMLTANQISFTLTSAEARTLANALLAAAGQNDTWLTKKHG